MTIIDSKTVEVNGARGYIDSLCASPYYGDTGLYVYVVAIDHSWSMYIAI